jgi:GDP-L-fucose synthase
MNKNSKIYITGHKGLVGSALTRELKEKGYTNLIFTSRKELDLRDQKEVESFFAEERPEYVFLAAAKVGGIMANSTYKAEFIYDNIMIAANIINSSYKSKVKKLLNLGSSCIYPRNAAQPLKEEYLLTSPLEPTNEPYAIAKIAAIKLCRYYNEQYGTNFISVMPTNLYGPGDNFNLETSHVLPALIRKFHLAKLLSNGDYETIIKDLKIFGNDPGTKDREDIKNYLADMGLHPDKVTLWGTGTPYREFLYVDDLAGACVYLMENHDASEIGEFVNIGTGKDIQIKDLAELIKDITGFKGNIEWDKSKPDGTPRKMLEVSRITGLGWKDSITLDEGINMVYGWYCDDE